MLNDFSSKGQLYTVLRLFFYVLSYSLIVGVGIRCSTWNTNVSSFILKLITREGGVRFMYSTNYDVRMPNMGVDKATIYNT